ncbi:hypothetical protein [Streptococcus dysgalactiae]|uniref:Uncharacterized protein n=1 Tax=Streptococcus dysgalactiae TaxID=1334 RepID=A0A9X9SJL9_STRDY|nr:hypothetical protein [Streptococcus dysgalactiae]VTS21829.1 Uncharacterised protein [Streptococcus dysgalactiae subsp. equisimilis]VTS42753.1 Uncharacterised protein [Streptococcus dysgalactiae subsp. equisimilis]VTS76239.1 Uncharacterised protein [Streptococcus dysgalactiae]VTS87828.1 Uncharacterised protein [Streptococcus dysgalactiae]
MLYRKVLPFHFKDRNEDYQLGYDSELAGEKHLSGFELGLDFSLGEIGFYFEGVTLPKGGSIEFLGE